MKSIVNKKCIPGRKGLAASLIITILFLLVMYFGIFGQGSIKGLKDSLIAGIVLAYFTFLIFMMFYTGDVNRWRKIFFTTYAVFFAVGFIWYTMGDRGHMWLLDREKFAWHLISSFVFCSANWPIYI